MKRVRVMNGKRFVAAYSETPFEEQKRKAVYPDFAFFEANNLNWCVRVGEIKICFGFGVDEVGYAAHGEILVLRQNLSAECFDGKGFPFKRSQNGIFYLYECEFAGRGFEGFCCRMRDELLPFIKEIAKECSPEGFETALQRNLPKIAGAQQVLKENALVFKGVQGVHAYKKGKI